MPDARTLLVALLVVGCHASPCDEATPCAPGSRRWTTDGACLPSDPCALDTTCTPSGRVCLGVEGRARCGRCLDDQIDDGSRCSPAVQSAIGPYRVTQDHFGVWDGTRYRRLFLRGVNVGGARPGELADETSLTVDDWMRWMGIWADAGLNVVRVYRAHPPPFYDALIRWNTEQPERPIYVVQGVYYRELDPGEPADLAPRGARFDQDVATAIDCVHGHCPGYADASPWVLAWLIGREVGTDEVLATNALHASDTSFAGEAFSITGASPSEAWVVARLDHAIVHERATYGVERPIGFTNWLELDPISHPSEPLASHQDVASLDLLRVDASRAPAGHFVSYHAYPYFPNFVNEDAIYRTYADALGIDAYRGLLAELRAHHAGQAVLISEFGVPTSLPPAHPSISGMTQGGIDEAQQGVFAARMLRDIEETGGAGGIWFQWEDGWWKRAWTSDHRAFPQDHFRLWHDLLNPEQGYGLMAFAPAPTPWRALTLTPTTGSRVRGVSASFDAERVRFRVELAAPLTGVDAVEIGIDVLDRGRGEPALPSGTRLVTSAAELALVIEGATPSATMSSTPCLDLTELPRDLLYAQAPATRAGGCGGWAPMRWLFSAFHYRPSGCFIADEFFPLGDLPIRRASAPASSRDVVVLDDGAAAPSVTIELPWNLIFVADPTTGAVLDDRPDMPHVDVSSTTDGIVLAVAVGGELVETEPFTWPTWDTAPVTTERLKDGTRTFFDYTRALPRWLD